jgi:hypothetical protein
MDGHHGALEFRPTRLDLAIARCCEMKATPNTQRITRIVTLLADEKAVLAVAGAVWVASRFIRNGSQVEADRAGRQRDCRGRSPPFDQGDCRQA